ncbi:Uu.00g012360.m01.CDS01 [Anthostomella pinea]|uniref:Uu.00g012360.m01.CDS01 n=1 Tax=Anthostomella pinea TaxID=933095 RepID=A0AAI8VXY4_9PEZI|nr:Uu.00g012360.m01.CDS01 [Anthostomella pinea]
MTASTPATAGEPLSSPIRYLPTTEAYDRWAAVYDTDGNFLQAMDDSEMENTLFPRFLDAITSPKPWRRVDLGCGTGRNTARLLKVPGAEEVVALDASPGMLDVARARLRAPASSTKRAEEQDQGWERRNKKLHFALFDLLSTTQSQSRPESALPDNASNADGIISTLVLEHIPLPTFFSQASALLRPGGVLLLTNMHADMGKISQAGFVDVGTGEKVRPVSYSHAVRDVVAEARRWGLEVVGWNGNGNHNGIVERGVEEEMVGRLGARSRKWVGVTL